MFYIAFIRFDIMGLKDQLVTLFFVDVVRRIVAETLIPSFLKFYRGKQYRAELQGSSNPEELVKFQAQM